VYVTDTGPGNTLIDACARHYFQQEYDKDAGFAKQGAVHPALLQALKADDFFRLDFPKTTGPELFSLDYVERAQAASGTTGLSPYDLIATLTRFSAETIAEAIRTVWRGGPIYISGGGAHNPLLIAWIKELLHPSTDVTLGTIHPSTDPVRPSAAPAADPILASPDTTTGIPSPSATFRITPTDQLGIPADAKEAVLFAVLANETIAGEPIDFGRPGMPAVTMGKISLP
jgi:anhydro-N-acetylmuramic acid kinase